MSERAWLLWYEDASVEPEIFAGAGAEKAAKSRFESSRQHWTCRLFVEHTQTPQHTKACSECGESYEYDPQLTDHVCPGCGEDVCDKCFENGNEHCGPRSW